MLLLLLHVVYASLFDCVATLTIIYLSQ